MTPPTHRRKQNANMRGGRRGHDTRPTSSAIRASIKTFFRHPIGTPHRDIPPGCPLLLPLAKAAGRIKSPSAAIDKTGAASKRFCRDTAVCGVPAIHNGGFCLNETDLFRSKTSPSVADVRAVAGRHYGFCCGFLLSAADPLYSIISPLQSAAPADPAFSVLLR